LRSRAQRCTSRFRIVPTTSPIPSPVLNTHALDYGPTAPASRVVRDVFSIKLWAHSDVKGCLENFIFDRSRRRSDCAASRNHATSRTRYGMSSKNGAEQSPDTEEPMVGDMIGWVAMRTTRQPACNEPHVHGAPASTNSE
jgi:hypothetical protein